MEHPIKMDDLGGKVPLFSETSTCLGSFFFKSSFMSLLRLLDDLIFALWIAASTVLLWTHANLQQKVWRNNKNIQDHRKKVYFCGLTCNLEDILWVLWKSCTPANGIWQIYMEPENGGLWNRRYSLEIIFLSFNLILFMGISWANDLTWKASKIHVGWRWKWWKWSPYQWWDCCGLVSQVVVAAWWTITVHLFQLVHWNTSEGCVFAKSLQSHFERNAGFWDYSFSSMISLPMLKKPSWVYLIEKKAANQT